jgi:hypothetical protein
MAPAYEVNRTLALEAERRGDALGATVRWCLAAHAAGSRLERVGALAGALRSADLALHQGVFAALWEEREDEEAEEWWYMPRHNRDRPSWRELAEATGIPSSTLNRRYRGKPPPGCPRTRWRPRAASSRV